MQDHQTNHLPHGALRGADPIAGRLTGSTVKSKPSLADMVTLAHATANEAHDVRQLVSRAREALAGPHPVEGRDTDCATDGPQGPGMVGELHEALRLIRASLNELRSEAEELNTAVS